VSDETEINYGGMTVNERLYEAGLISEWDHAAHARDRHRMVELLRKVDLSRDAEKICDAILANPEFYGF
jgi:hypothetical protein